MRVGSAKVKFQSRITAVVSILLLPAILLAGTARAASFTIGGPSAEATVRTDNTRVLYGSDGTGKTVLITEVGRLAPGGEHFTELGVPSMTADGKVLFGAESMGADKHPHWDIFIGDPSADPGHRVSQALQVQSGSLNCIPRFNGDPYAVADESGSIAFSAPEASGHRDTLFMYANGKLDCLARAGDKTKGGNTLTVLGFGTIQTAEPGRVVFTGFLAGEKQALLTAKRGGVVEELAVEGQEGPGHAIYGHGFGLPAALGSPEDTLVAFTDKTSSGTSLYLYRGGSVSRILPSGTQTPLGPVTYLSPGRPGLMADGTTAVLTGCARVPAIFRLANGRLDLTLQRGLISPLGATLVSLGDPSLTASGEMYLGAIDTEDQEKLYKFSGDNGLSEVGSSALLYNIAFNPDAPPPSHSIFTGTLTVNQHGDFAYLGGE